MTEVPTQAAFWVAPIETTAAIALRTMVYALGVTRAEEIWVKFSEDVPLIALYCSFGKSAISPELFLSHLDGYFYEI